MLNCNTSLKGRFPQPERVIQCVNKAINVSGALLVKSRACCILDESRTVMGVVNDSSISTGGHFGESFPRDIRMPKVIIEDPSAIATCVILELQYKVQTFVDGAQPFVHSLSVGDAVLTGRNEVQPRLAGL